MYIINPALNLWYASQLWEFCRSAISHITNTIFTLLLLVMPYYSVCVFPCRAPFLAHCKVAISAYPIIISTDRQWLYPVAWADVIGATLFLSLYLGCGPNACRSRTWDGDNGMVTKAQAISPCRMSIPFQDWNSKWTHRLISHKL